MLIESGINVQETPLGILPRSSCRDLLGLVCGAVQGLNFCSAPGGGVFAQRVCVCVCGTAWGGGAVP